MRTRTLIAGLVVVVTAALPGEALASIQQATVADPGGDQADPGLDVVAASARHDTQAGTTFTITLRGAPSSAPGASVLAAVGVYDGSSCSGRVQVAGSLLPGSTAVAGVTFDDAGRAVETPVTKTADATTITLTTPGVRPGGGPVDCAFLRTYDASTAGQPAYDGVPRFALTDTAAPGGPPPTTPPPTTPPAGPAPGAPTGTARFRLSTRVPSLTRAKRSFVYGLCGFSICRVDPVSRRRTRVLAATSSRTAYTAVATARSGGVTAFARGGRVYRAARDGRGRVDYGDGTAPAVRPDGGVVAFERTIPVQSPPICTPDLSGGPLTCTFTTPVVPTPTIFYRSTKDTKPAEHGDADGTFAWSRDLLVRTSTAAGSQPSFVCATTPAGACARTIAQDPARVLTSPQASSDGRRLVAVAEPRGARNADAPALRGALVLYDPATGRKVRDLTKGTGDAHPAFSPDGRQVAFNRGRDLYVIGVGGGTPRLLQRGFVLTGASWSLAR